MKLPLVYVSGAITQGQPTRIDNFANALKAQEYLRQQYIHCIVPHYNMLLGFIKDYGDNAYEAFIEWDFQVIRRCDGLVRLPGESPGADREVELAKSLNIPVFIGQYWMTSCDLAIAHFHTLENELR